MFSPYCSPSDRSRGKVPDMVIHAISLHLLTSHKHTNIPVCQHCKDRQLSKRCCAKNILKMSLYLNFSTLQQHVLALSDLFLNNSYFFLNNNVLLVGTRQMFILLCVTFLVIVIIVSNQNDNHFAQTLN